MRALIAILGILAVVCVCQGRTITVDDDGPADFYTIQAAIDESNGGDTIIAADGTYTGPGTLGGPLPTAKTIEKNASSLSVEC